MVREFAIMRSHLYCPLSLLIIVGLLSGCRSQQLEGDTVSTPMAVPEESAHTGSAAQTAKQQAEAKTEAENAATTAMPYTEAVSAAEGSEGTDVMVQSSPTIPEGATVLTEADNGGSTAVEANTSIVVQLSGNPTTGYTWSVNSYDTGILSLEGHDYTADTSDGVGSGGTFTFLFKALAPGSSTIKLSYARPWEKDVPAAKTYSTEVDVQ